MSPGEHLPADEKENQSNPAKGGASLRAPQEILSTRDPVSGGNAADLISTQPLPASQGASGPRKPQSDPQKPTCPRCGLAVPDQRLHPIPPSLSRLQGSGLSAKCSGSRKRDGSKGSEASSHQPAATPSDSCFHLLLACLSCQCSVLLLGLLEACSSCLHGLCSSCCHACARCCSAVQEAPVEEFNCHAHCHSYLFESCCEPTECLEFCLECCELCHRS